MAQEELVNILHAGSFLLDTSGTTERDLKNILVHRLTQYHQTLGSSPPSLDTVEHAQLETAQCALHVVERVQNLLDKQDLCSVHHEGDPANAPVIGVRDLNALRTLLCLVFRWGTEPLYTRISPSFPSKPTASTPKIIDLTYTPADQAALSELLLRLMGLLFPGGPKSTPPQTLISSTLLARHVVDLLRPSMALGWLPRAPVQSLRPFVHHLLAFIPLPQIMSSLATILSTPNPPTPLHVRKLCATLLTQNLLRPDGVQAFCSAVFGELDTEEEPELVKLEQVARVLGTVPRAMQPKEYFQIIVPRILALVSPPSRIPISKTPSIFKRAAAFSLARMLDSRTAHHGLVASIAFPILHDPLYKVSEGSHEQSGTDQSQHISTPISSLQTLHALILATDPSPSLFSSLLSPILPSLYALHSHISEIGAADPVLKEDVWMLMRTWGRVVEEHEGIQVLWSLVEDGGGSSGGWEGGSVENLRRVRRVNREEKLALLTPGDVRHASHAEGMDIESLDLGLYPRPTHFVSYIESLDRKDIAGGVFVRLLEAYRIANNSVGQDVSTMNERQDILMDQKEPDPLRVMLLLQLIMAFQTQMDNTVILSRPRDVLEFVRHALEVSESGTSKYGITNERKKGLFKEHLRFVPEVQDTVGSGEDSDDETEIEGEDMVENAIGLLLAILEGNPSLTLRNTPSLSRILALLGAHTPTRPSAREARLVLTARIAEGTLDSDESDPKSIKDKSRTKCRSDEHADPRETYQKALKLLQDPLLPVRAHGLLLLRQLITSPARATENEHEKAETEATIRALQPAVLSIFLQAIQEDDSYVFLNAVQGLAVLVHAPGAGSNSKYGTGYEVLKRLLDAYARGAEDLVGDQIKSGGKPKGGEKSEAGRCISEIDTRLRIGEALAIIVRQCGDALGAYADILLPPLIFLFSEPRAPVVLRTSAISLLSECVNTYNLVVERYREELVHGMLDLVLVEMTVATPARPPARTEGAKTKNMEEGNIGSSKPTLVSESQPERSADTLDISPLSISPKVPALRRAALHFLALLFRALTKEAYERINTSLGDSGWSGVQIGGIYGKDLYNSNRIPAHDDGSLTLGYIRRARTVLGYIAIVDEDAVVRAMAREVVEGLEGLQEALLQLKTQ